MSKRKLVEVKGLKCYFGSSSKQVVKAVDDISFEIFEGETFGLVGESGSGKSTTGRSILRLNDATDGQILFDGKEIPTKTKELKDFRKQAQMIFQDPYASLNSRMTVGDIIAEGIDLHKLASSKQERMEKVYKLLEIVGLNREHASRFPHEFSGGQRQRICIARALAVNPRLMICDESVSALDVSIQAQVLNLLNRLKAERNLTYVFISHDLSVVCFMSDRILVMHNGKPVELNDADLLFEAPQNAYTKKLIDALPGRRLQFL